MIILFFLDGHFFLGASFAWHGKAWQSMALFVGEILWLQAARVKLLLGNCGDEQLGVPSLLEATHLILTMRRRVPENAFQNAFFHPEKAKCWSLK